MSLERAISYSKRYIVPRSEGSKEPPYDTRRTVIRSTVLGPEFNPKKFPRSGVKEIAIPNDELQPSVPIHHSTTDIRQINVEESTAATFSSGDRVAGLAYVAVNSKQEVTLSIPTRAGVGAAETSIVAMVGKAHGGTLDTLRRFQDRQVPVGVLVALGAAAREQVHDGEHRFVGALEIPYLVEPVTNPTRRQLRQHKPGATVIIAGEVTQADHTVAVENAGSRYEMPSHADLLYSGPDHYGLEPGDVLTTQAVVGSERSLSFGTNKPRLVRFSGERLAALHAQILAHQKDVLSSDMAKADYRSALNALGLLTQEIYTDRPEEVNEIVGLHMWFAGKAGQSEKTLMTDPTSIISAQRIYESSGINLGSATRGEVLAQSPDGMQGYAIDLLSGRVSGILDKEGTPQPLRDVLQLVGDHYGEQVRENIIIDQVQERMKQYEPSRSESGHQRTQTGMRVASEVGRAQQQLILREYIMQLSAGKSYHSAEVLSGVLNHFFGEHWGDLSRDERNTFVETTIAGLYSSIIANPDKINSLVKTDDEESETMGIMEAGLRDYMGEVSDTNKPQLRWLIDMVGAGNAVYDKLRTEIAADRVEHLSAPTSPASDVDFRPEMPRATGVAAFFGAIAGRRSVTGATSGENADAGLGAEGSVSEQQVEEQTIFPDTTARVRDALAAAHQREGLNLTEVSLPEEIAGDGEASDEERVIQTETGDVTIAGVTDAGLQMRKPGSNLPTSQPGQDLFRASKVDPTDQ